MSARDNTGKQIRDGAKNADYNDIRPYPNNNEENNPPSNVGVYRNYIANYSKGLPHHGINSPQAGEVIVPAYQSLLNAVGNENAPNAPPPAPPVFEAIQLGGSRKLVDPQAGLAFDLEGTDSHSINPALMPPAPRIDSAEAAGEMAELYWMALARDVPFKEFDTNYLIREAIDDLSQNYGSFPVPPYPPAGHTIDTTTIFRGFTLGDVMGPFISQFLLKGNNDPVLGLSENDGYITYGSLKINQRQLTVKPRSDFLTRYRRWLAVQDGFDPRLASRTCGNKYDTSNLRFIRNMRDLANYVHYDDLPQEFINACLILLHKQVPCLDIPTFDPGNPYINSNTQTGFGTFGQPHVLSLLPEVVTRALKAVWYQKWFVHRRLRPEAFGGLIHRQLNTIRPPRRPIPAYPIHQDILNSIVVRRIYSTFGSYLLPQAFPEGSPTHPSYGAGHATVAGACVTILKAFFDENFPISDPVLANENGTELISYNGPDRNNLTVGSELNKLAANIAIGRNMAGVHYRSDYTFSVRLGESVAVSILQDQRMTYNEDYSFSFTSFDGAPINITKP